MQRVHLLLLVNRSSGIRYISDYRRHSCHRLSQVVAGSLQFLSLACQFIDNLLFLSPYIIDSLRHRAVDIHRSDNHNHIHENHPPLHPPGVGYLDYEHAFLSAHSTVSAHGLHVQCIFAALQFLECHSVLQGVGIAPFVVESFHPIHELQSFALVVVAGREFQAECVLTAHQFQFVALVESLGQGHHSVVFVSCLYLCFSDKQLCQHHSRQRVGVVLAPLAYPVHAIQSAEQHVAVVLADYGPGIKLVALQSVREVIVI